MQLSLELCLPIHQAGMFTRGHTKKEACDKINFNSGIPTTLFVQKKKIIIKKELHVIYCSLQE